MNTPSPYVFLLLGLAAWSVFHLLAHDDILDKYRRKVLRMGTDWQKEGDEVPEEYRLKWALFLTCPYCAGFWIWMAWIVLYWIVPGVALPLAVFWGGRAMVIAGQKLLGKEEDRTVSKDAEAIQDGLFIVGKRIEVGMERVARKQAVRSRS